MRLLLDNLIVRWTEWRQRRQERRRAMAFYTRIAEWERADPERKED